MPGPLAGIRVLDFTWALAGPFATMVLADLGAEVIKVEWPDLTEEERGPGPYVQGFSTFFLSVNRGKKSVALDLQSDAGRVVIHELVKNVDVVTENFRPGTMQALGLGYDDLKVENPRLVYASCSGFGQTGPRASEGALDIIVQALSGMMSINGQPDGPPTRVGVSIGDVAAGLYLSIGVLSALLEREKSGTGQQVDIAMLDAQMALLENAVVRFTATGEEPGRLGSRSAVSTPFQALPTSDGWLVMAGVKNWDLLCIKLGRPELALDERFSTDRLRTEHHAELEPLLGALLRVRPTDDWIGELGEVALVAPVRSVSEAIRDPQLAARDMLMTTQLPGGAEGNVTVSGNPVKLSRSLSQAAKAAPLLGEHTHTILRELAGLSEEQVETLQQSRNSSAGERNGVVND